MYIKREPLGQGNLVFGRRRRKHPVGFIILYLAILAAALFLFIQMDAIQPKVLAIVGPAPTPTLSPQELVAQGDQAYHDGDMATAVTIYEQAAQLAPTDMAIMFSYGRLLILTQHPQDAIAVGDQMILSAPDDPRGYLIRARALDWAGEPDQAQIEALKAVEKDPNNALAHAYLAEAFADLGRIRQAQEQAEQAVALDPYNVDVRRNYAYVLEFYGDYNGAIQQYIQALQLEPNMLDLWYGLAHNYRGEGQYDKSIETFAQIAKRIPDNPDLYWDWGKTYFEMRDDPAAQETLEQAVSLVCDGGQAGQGVAEDKRKDCPFLTSADLFEDAENNSWTVSPNRKPRENQIPWKKENRPVPPKVLLKAWTLLGQVYLTRRNYEDAIAILAEAVAWGEAQDPKAESYKKVPIEAYYVMATAYYYKDMCQFAIPLTVEAFNKYQTEELEDAGALKNILSLFVLCRDFADDPVVHKGPGFTNGFPEGYEEPDVRVQRGESNNSNENSNDNNAGDGNGDNSGYSNDNSGG